MTTEPLDVGSLITAVEGEDWSGAPAGTTMGHVHLHVGDLATAEAFYHRAMGFHKEGVELSGGTLLLCRWLSPSSRDERLVAWTLSPRR
jgi:hypothetical protein